MKCKRFKFLEVKHKKRDSGTDRYEEEGLREVGEQSPVCTDLKRSLTTL